MRSTQICEQHGPHWPGHGNVLKRGAGPWGDNIVLLDKNSWNGTRPLGLRDVDGSTGYGAGAQILYKGN